MTLADDHKVKNILCDSCDNGDVAENRCKECGVFLCHFCAEFHKRSRATKLHQLLSMEELKSAAGPDIIAEKIRCVKHKEEVIKLYCKTCQVTICRDCTIVDHREHEYGFVEDVALKERQNLKMNLDEVKLRKVRVVQGIVNLKRFDEGLVAKKEVTVSQINGHFDELARVMASRKRELVEKAEALTTSKRKKIHAQMEQLEMALASCESSIGFTEQAFKNGNDVQILSMRKYILESLENLKTVKDQTRPCVSGDIVFAIPMTVEDTRSRLFNLFTVDDDAACPEASKASFNDPQERLEPGKQATITVVCNNKFSRRVRHGGQLIKPTFIGVDVSDVTVADNNDGSHLLTFIPRSCGMLKFEVTINGTPAPPCSLTVNSKWVMSDAHGMGTISNDGLTMSTEGFEGQYCYRIGGYYFESGVHTWKVNLSEFKYGRATPMRGVGYGTSRRSNKRRILRADVGVVDCGEIDPTTKPNANGDVGDHEKCVRAFNWQKGQSFDIVVTLDMENKTLQVLDGNQYPQADYNEYYLYGDEIPEVYKFTAQRVCPFFGSSSPYVSISIVE